MMDHGDDLRQILIQGRSDSVLLVAGGVDGDGAGSKESLAGAGSWPGVWSKRGGAVGGGEAASPMVNKTFTDIVVLR